MTEQHHPGKSRDPKALLNYFIELGFTPEEGQSLVPNWSRTEPQTMEEVRQGILDERGAREAQADQTWGKNLLERPLLHRCSGQFLG